MIVMFRGIFTLRTVSSILMLFCLLALFFLNVAPAANAQDQLPTNDEPLAEEEQAPTLAAERTLAENQTTTAEQNRIDMDIRTSTLSELAAWCRSLGLPEGGTNADLARRLREHFGISEHIPKAADDRKIITIESARSSEYFTIETVDEDYARLSGDVMISLKDGDAVHRIQARNILFNRTRNIITASGDVVYVKEENETIETFRGDSITVDLDNWSSIFLGGVSERSLQSDNTTYLFSGTVITHDDEDSIVLSKASIRSANNEDSLWSLNATRIWLLPGSDFAVFNAVLKVGEIPVLYIPFFHYPADELIFHPVVGFRTREGSFAQTTTYILGRPKADSSSESSLTRILGNSNDMEKKREGLFLRSTGKKVVDPDTISLKALLDYYTNLGLYIGTDLYVPAKGIFDKSDLSLGLGFTRTIVQDGGNYTPFFPKYDGSTDRNHSNLFSTQVPFRYRFIGSTSLSGKYLSVSLNLPFYSDPMVDSDFMDRSESMDWVNMMQQGAATREEETTQNTLGNYTWELSGRVSPDVSKLSPYITGITISNISTTLAFKTIDKRISYGPGEAGYYSPSSFFYVPETATLYSISGTITGRPFSLGASNASSTGVKAEPSDPLKGIGIPRSPFEDREKTETQSKDQSDDLVPPVLSQRFDLPRIGSNNFYIDYRLAPTSFSTLKFNNGDWNDFGEISWSDVSSRLTSISGDTQVAFNLNHSTGLYTSTLTFKGNGTWRQYDYINEEAQDYLTAGNPDPDKVSNAKLQEYKNSFFTTSYNITTSLRPFYYNPIFGASSLSYTLGGLIVRTRFSQTGTAENPDWDFIWGKFAKDGTEGKEEGIPFIDTHQISANLSALVLDKTQTLSLAAELYPRVTSFSWRTGIRAWISETDANMRIRHPVNSVERKIEPLYLDERLIFGSFGNFSLNLVRNFDDLIESNNGLDAHSWKSLTTTLNLTKWGLSASYNATRMRGYKYERPDPSSPSGRWVEREDEPRLQSNYFKLTYVNNTKKQGLWGGRLQFNVNVNTSLNFNLQEYTRSNLLFSLGFTLGINNFLDLTFSANSENAYIYRYFRNMPFFSDADIYIPSGPQNNPFLDLINSFRFDDDSLRRSSGYKMKGFSISAKHYLGDWTAELDWAMVPERSSTSNQYEINNKVSFLVKWIPISEIKSDITYNKNYDPAWTVK
jgi:hypothetical protein